MDKSLKQLDDLILEINKDLESCKDSDTLNDTIIDSPRKSQKFSNDKSIDTNLDEILYNYVNERYPIKKDNIDKFDTNIETNNFIRSSWPSSKKRASLVEKIIKIYKKKLSR